MWKDSAKPVQFSQMLPSGLLPLRVLRPDIRLDGQLPNDEGEERRRRIGIGRKGKSGKTEVAELYREAEPIVTAAALTNG
jgi:hypothetical protein